MSDHHNYSDQTLGKRGKTKIGAAKQSKARLIDYRILNLCIFLVIG